MGNATKNRTMCPRCKVNLLKKVNATSRRDNKTQICSSCGTAEAFEDSGLRPQWLDDPRNMPYWDATSPQWLNQADDQHNRECGLDALIEEAESTGEVPHELR